MAKVWVRTLSDGLVRADQIVSVTSHSTPAPSGKPARWLLDATVAVSTGSGHAGSWSVGMLCRTLIQTPAEPVERPEALARLLAVLHDTDAAGIITPVPAEPSETGRFGSGVRFSFTPFNDTGSPLISVRPKHTNRRAGRGGLQVPQMPPSDQDWNVDRDRFAADAYRATATGGEPARDHGAPLGPLAQQFATLTYSPLDATTVGEVSVTLRSADGTFHTPAMTDPVAAELDQLQYELREGPCLGRRRSRRARRRGQRRPGRRESLAAVRPRGRRARARSGVVHRAAAGGAGPRQVRRAPHRATAAGDRFPGCQQNLNVKLVRLAETVTRNDAEIDSLHPPRQ